MAGVQKLFYIPEPHTDFIFAVIGEELGLVGTTLIAAVLRRHRLARAAHVARSRPIGSASLLALGLTMMVALQALVNMSVVIGLAADQGHSAAVRQQWRIVAARSTWSAMGILLNISQQASPTAARRRPVDGDWDVEGYEA